MASRSLCEQAWVIEFTAATSAKSFAPGTNLPQQTSEPDFAPRHALDAIGLLECFSWDEETFLRKTEGSAIRRIGYERWRRKCRRGLGQRTVEP